MLMALKPSSTGILSEELTYTPDLTFVPHRYARMLPNKPRIEKCEALRPTERNLRFGWSGRDHENRAQF